MFILQGKKQLFFSAIGIENRLAAFVKYKHSSTLEETWTSACRVCTACSTHYSFLYYLPVYIQRITWDKAHEELTYKVSDGDFLESDEDQRGWNGVQMTKQNESWWFLEMWLFLPVLS